MADNEHLTDVVKDIKYLVDKYNKKVKATKISKSVSQQLFIDFAMLYSLLDMFHINDADLQMVRPYSYFDHYLPAKAKRDIEQLREVSEPAIQAYKDAGYFFQNTSSQQQFTTFDSQVIIQDFMEECFPHLVDFMDYLYDHQCLLINQALVRSASAHGLSFMFPTIDEYRMFIDDGDLSTIGGMSTFVHEFMHLYAAKVLYAANKKRYYNYKTGYCLETPTVFVELCLYEFLKNTGIDELECAKNLNAMDYTCLESFKDIVFLSEMGRRGHTINWKEQPITIQGNVQDCEIDRGIPWFEYEKGLNGIDNGCLEYSTGVLKAYQMFEQVLAGEHPEKVLFEFFNSLDKDLRIKDIVPQDYNYGFLKDEVERRVKLLK